MPPGGHWTRAYPFVRLHQPSAYYGVNSRRGSTVSTLTRMVRAADAAMYQAKRPGGNKCHHYSEPYR